MRSPGPGAGPVGTTGGGVSPERGGGVSGGGSVMARSRCSPLEGIDRRRVIEPPARRAATRAIALTRLWIEPHGDRRVGHRLEAVLRGTEARLAESNVARAARWQHQIAGR